MTRTVPKDQFVRYVAGSLLLLLAINAFGGGYYGMSGAKEIPVEWLSGSPFHSYFIPGLFLFAVVGGSALLASILVFRKHPLGRNAAIACGILVLAWLIVQMAIIGYVSWMQPATAITAVLILLLSRQIKTHA
jgi:hypothetical protein